MLTVTEGPGLVARLREFLDRATASRLLIYPSPSGGGPGPPAHASRAERAMRAFEAVDGGSQVGVLAASITDTCKEVVDGYVRRTVPRDTLVDARGPWMFPREVLSEALNRVSPRETISTLVDLCRVADLNVHVLTQP